LHKGLFLLLTSTLAMACAWSKKTQSNDLCGCLTNTNTKQHIEDYKTKAEMAELEAKKLQQLEEILYKLEASIPGSNLVVIIGSDWEDGTSWGSVQELVWVGGGGDDLTIYRADFLDDPFLTFADTTIWCLVWYNNQVGIANQTDLEASEAKRIAQKDILNDVSCLLCKNRENRLNKEERELLIGILMDISTLDDRKICDVLKVFGSEFTFFLQKVNTKQASQRDHDILLCLNYLLLEVINVPITGDQDQDDIEVTTETKILSVDTLVYRTAYWHGSVQTIGWLRWDTHVFDQDQEPYETWVGRLRNDLQEIQDEFTQHGGRPRIERWNIQDWIIRNLDLWGRNCPVTVKISFVWGVTAWSTPWQFWWPVANDPKLGAQEFTGVHISEINEHALEMYTYCISTHPSQKIFMLFSVYSANKTIAKRKLQIH